MSLAAVVWIPKMVAGLSGRTQNGRFIIPKIIGIHFSLFTKIPSDTLLRKMPAELLSTEQIFADTSRLGPCLLLFFSNYG